MRFSSFIAGWICGWGAIVLVGLLAGLLLRLTRPRAPHRAHLLQVERPSGAVARIPISRRVL